MPADRPTSYNTVIQCGSLIREGVLCGMQNLEKVYFVEFHLQKIFAE